MDAKRCSRCHQLRPVSDFSLSRRARDGLQSRCRACWRDWYVENREQHLEAVARRNATARAEHQRRITEHLLVHPCVDCGERDLRVLDFDHDDPAVKAADVARLAAMHVPWTRIADEIAKCSVRCANCHRRRTAEIFGYWRAGAEQDRRAALREEAEHRLLRVAPS